MKLFFYAATVFVTTVMVSGCGTSSQNDGQGYATKKIDVKMTGTGMPDSAPSKMSLPEATLPEADAPKATSPDTTSESTRNRPLNNVREVEPVRRVAKNVRLGKENIGGITEKELLLKLQEVSAKTDVAVRDASYDAKTWILKEGKPGKSLNTDKLMKAALSAKEGQVLQYSYSQLQPKVNSEELKGKITLISQYSTPFLDRSKSRIKNIRITSAKLDRKIIQPGQKFSFNALTGSKSKKNGYEDATVIVRTPEGPKHKKAPGGGVCQISTTLYNAVMKCGLKVTERHEHSDDVHYVPDGKDATVTYGGADFRFVNNRNHPIMLRITVTRGSLKVKIYENTAAT